MAGIILPRDAALTERWRSPADSWRLAVASWREADDSAMPMKKRDALKKQESGCYDAQIEIGDAEVLVKWSAIGSGKRGQRGS